MIFFFKKISVSIYNLNMLCCDPHPDLSRGDYFLPDRMILIRSKPALHRTWMKVAAFNLPALILLFSPWPTGAMVNQQPLNSLRCDSFVPIQLSLSGKNCSVWWKLREGSDWLIWGMIRFLPSSTFLGQLSPHGPLSVHLIPSILVTQIIWSSSSDHSPDFVLWSSRDAVCLMVKYRENIGDYIREKKRKRYIHRDT